MPVETLFKPKADYKDKIKISFKRIDYEIETSRLLSIIRMLEEDKLLKFENETHIERLIHKHNLAKRVFFEDMNRF